MNYKLKKLVRTLLLCFSCLLLASSCKTVSVLNDNPLDHVITIDGDTLYGKVEYFRKNNQYGGDTFYRKLRLKETNGKERRLKYRNVASFTVDGDEYRGFLLTVESSFFKFGSKHTSKYFLDEDGALYFLKVWDKGNKLSHYTDEFYDSYNNNLWSAHLIKKAEDNFFIRTNGGPFQGLKRKALTNYFSDCADIQEKIEQKHFEYTFQVVDYYNENCGKE